MKSIFDSSNNIKNSIDSSESEFSFQKYLNQGSIEPEMKIIPSKVRIMISILSINKLFRVNLQGS